MAPRSVTGVTGVVYHLSTLGMLEKKLEEFNFVHFAFTTGHPSTDVK